MSINKLEIKRIGSKVSIIADADTIRRFLIGLDIVEGDVVASYADQDIEGMAALDAYQDVRNQIRGTIFPRKTR